MTAERLITYMLASTSNPMVIIAPADVRIGQHLLLLPLLLLCYKAALCGWMASNGAARRARRSTSGSRCCSPAQPARCWCS